MAYFQTHGVALVTGAAGGIGQGAANCLAAVGASTVFFADVDLPRAQGAAEESRKRMLYMWTISNPASVEKLVQTVVDTAKTIDYLVNAAGIDTASYSPAPDIDLDDYDHVMSINTRGMLLGSRAVSKVMLANGPRMLTTMTGITRELSRGVIINVTSVMSYGVIPGKTAYATSKHASLGLTKSFAVDVGPKGLRVNCICPTWVRTPMFEGECAKVPRTLDLVKAISPLQQEAEVDEVGNSIVYLCSPAASYVNGIGLIIHNGLTLTLHLG